MLSMRIAGIFFVCLVTAGLVSAQEYPSKPIRIITSSPGSGSDFVARLIAQGISGPLGQPVIVDNRPSNLTGEIAMKALPDGYTLLVEGNSFWLAPLLQKTPYDPLRDFSPITIFLTAPNVIAVHPSVPANSIAELVALAKAKPGQLNYGSSGAGSSQQLAVEMLKFMAGINIVHVPYKGVVPAVNAVMAGEIQLVAATASLIGPQMKAGKLKALAVTSAKPSPVLPTLPTLASAGYPGYEFVTRTVLFATGKQPSAIVTRLNRETVRIINSADTKEKLANIGVEPGGNTPEEFIAIIKNDVVVIGKVIKEAGITAD